MNARRRRQGRRVLTPGAVRRSFAGFAVVLMLLTGCAAEPPFDVESATSRLEEAPSSWGEVIIEPAGVDDVLVHRTSIEAPGGDPVPVDIYYPPEFHFRRAEPAVFVSCGNPNWSYTISLGRALAASGLVAVATDTRNYGGEFPRVVEAMRNRGGELFLDPQKLALWGEGHVSGFALEAAMNDGHAFHDAVQGAVFLSPVLFMGAEESFAHDAAELSSDVPVFIVKAADDSFYEVRATVESFREAADVAGVEVEYVEVPAGGHNWMSDADSEEAREAFRAAVSFLSERL